MATRSRLPDRDNTGTEIGRISPLDDEPIGGNPPVLPVPSEDGSTIWPGFRSVIHCQPCWSLFCYNNPWSTIQRCSRFAPVEWLYVG